MRFTDIIWDFDGTLCDTYPHIAYLFSRVLDEMGIAYEEDDLRRRLSTTFSRTIAYYARSREEGSQIYRRYFELENHELGRIQAYDGIVEVLDYIKAHGGCSHICTHRGASLYKYLDHLKLRGRFSTIVNYSDGYALKPSPESVLSIIHRRGIEASQALMIGDRDIDTAAGKAAGTATCLLNTNGIARPETADWEVFQPLNILNIIES